MEKTKLVSNAMPLRTPSKEQVKSLARILSIEYAEVLQLKPQIEVATNWDKNHDFLLVEICGDPPEELLHKIDRHIVGRKYIHLPYGVLDSTVAKERQ